MAPVYLIGAIVIAAGCVLIWVAAASWQERLQRGLPVGVRTPATMRSDEAFTVANKVAAPYAGAGGGVMILGGAIAMVVPKQLFGVPLFAGILIGLAVALAGAAAGVRACKRPRPDAVS
jgi:SdpI/YfhL protein family